MANNLEDFLHKKADLLKTPFAGSMELTPLCNLDCKMCYIHHTPEEAEREGGVQSVDFWLNLIPQMREAGTLIVNLIGGEPFIFKGIEKLYLELINNGIRVSITSNGILLAKQIPKWLIEHKPRFVSVSVYGCCNETYKNVCGIENGFDQVCKAIENLKNAGIGVSIKSCITRENQHEIDEIYKLAAKYKCKLEMSSYNYPPARRDNTELDRNSRISAEETAINEMLQLKLKMKEKYYDYCSYLSNEDFPQNTEKHTEDFTCRAGTSTFWINWKGIMSPCGMFEDFGYDLHEMTYQEAWNKVKSDVESVHTCSDCAVCKKRSICYVCPAKMKAETGSFTGKPIYVCDVTDHMIQIAKNDTQ